MNTPWGYLKSNTEGYEDIPLILDCTSVGRNYQQTLANNTRISATHFLIKKGTEENEPVFLVDTSTNGTFINHKKYEKEANIFCYDDINLCSPDYFGTISYTFIDNTVEQEDIVNGGIQNDFDIGRYVGGIYYSVRREIQKKDTKERFLVKIIRKKLSPNSTMTQNEINIMQTVNNPNIVKLFKTIITNDHIFLITEFVEGGDLSHYLFKTVFSRKQTQFIVYQVLNALKYLSKKNIIHRGIKPENILFVNKNECIIKLSDFAFSRRIDKLSLASTCCGSNYFIAPEIVQNGIKKIPYNASKVDIWSVGVLLYMMSYNRFPNSFDSYPFIQTAPSCFLNFETTFDDNLLFKTAQDDLISSMLNLDPKNRPTPEEALNHNYFNF